MCNGYIVIVSNGLSQTVTGYLTIKCTNQEVTRYVVAHTFQNTIFTNE